MNLRIPAVALALGFLGSVPSQAVTPPPEPLGAPFTLVVTDAAALANPPSGETVRWGLGVYPTARTPQAFAEVFWHGARPGDGIAGSLGDLGLVDLLGESRPTATFIEPGAPALALAFAAVMDLQDSPDPVVSIVVTADPWPWLQRRLDVFVFGVDEDLPILVATRGTDPPGDALLDPTGPGHPGLLGPFDLTASIAEVLQLDLPEGYPGQTLTTVEHPRPREAVEALRDRFQRDARWPFSVAVVMIVLLLAVAFAAGLAVRLVVTAGPHAARLGQRLAAASAVTFLAIPLGYLVALFLPSGSAGVRSLPILLTAGVGATLAFRAERRTASIAVGRMGNLLAVAIVVLTITSAMRPGGEPALSFWDSPLASFRVAGLRNALAAFLVGGLLAAFGTRRLHRSGLVIVGVISVATMGLPWLGSNIIAVLAGTAAIVIALEVDLHERLRLLGACKAVALAALATGLALLADRPGVTHAGRLVDATQARGPGLFFEIIGSRIETNLSRVGEVGVLGWIGLVGLTIVLLLLFHDAIRGHGRAGTHRLVSRLDSTTRSGIAGVTSGALVSLVLEDTGFLTAGTLAPFALALVAAAAAATLPGPDG